MYGIIRACNFFLPSLKRGEQITNSESLARSRYKEGREREGKKRIRRSDVSRLILRKICGGDEMEWRDVLRKIG